jgi:UDP-N-acetylglucosamine 2-epimerase (non-hydrolysing)
MFANASFVITDSRGVQEEAALLRVPCGILRQTTERPEALAKNMSYLIKPSGIRRFAIQSIATKRRAKKIRYWDGNTAKRIAQGVQKILGRKII